jgi:hypothetical protein
MTMFYDEQRPVAWAGADPDPFQALFEELTDGLPERPMAIVRDWWGGKCIQRSSDPEPAMAPEYAGYTLEERREAARIVTYLACRGLG